MNGRRNSSAEVVIKNWTDPRTRSEKFLHINTKMPLQFHIFKMNDEFSLKFQKGCCCQLSINWLWVWGWDYSAKSTTKQKWSKASEMNCQSQCIFVLENKTWGAQVSPTFLNTIHTTKIDREENSNPSSNGNDNRFCLCQYRKWVSSSTHLFLSLFNFQTPAWVAQECSCLRFITRWGSHLWTLESVWRQPNSEYNRKYQNKDYDSLDLFVRVWN